MKTKGINPIERNVEKVVLSLAAAFVLGVLLMQTGLVGGSPRVKVGSAERPVDEALLGVKEIAFQRQGRLQSDQVAAGIPASLPDPLQVFEQAIASSSGANTPLAALGKSPLRLGDDLATSGIALPKGGGDTRFAAIRVPVPGVPVVGEFEGTIDPIEVAKVGAGLAAALPEAQPFDLRAISVETTLDAAGLRRSLETPGEEGASPLPAALWQGRLELVDIEWIRQERTTTGEWGEETVLPPLPGRATIREIVGKTDFQPADFRELIERERQERQVIRRPPFYATIAGRSWVWPSQAKKESESKDATDVVALKQELAALRRELDDLRRRLERVNNPGGKPPQAPPGGKPPAGGGGGGGGGDRGPTASAEPRQTPHGVSDSSFDWPVLQHGWLAQGAPAGGRRPGGSSDPPADRGKDREAAAKKKLEDDIAKLDKREKEIVAELEAKGVAAQGLQTPIAFEEPLGSLSSNETQQITLWTHDLAARPGATYRYKARATLTNPFYGQLEKLRDDQKALAEKPTIVGEASQWSEPMAIEPNVVFFITSASEAGGPIATTAKASAEMYEFYYGYWRRTSVTMSPGDRLAGTIPLPELFAYEIVREGESGSRYAVKDKSALEREKTVETDLFLLDTASVLSGPAGAAQAYLAAGRAGLIVRRPANEGPEAARRGRFQASAALAESATTREPGASPESDGRGRPPAPPDEPGRDGGRTPPGGGPGDSDRR